MAEFTHTPILILGMHRSGTSCLTGCLEEAGLFLGDVNHQAGFNKKGNKENKAVMELHQSIFQRFGSDWDDPPVSKPNWTDDEVERLRIILSTYKTGQAWGIKDPRTLFLMDGWMRLTTPSFIGTFRHPASVAASLMKRADAWGQLMTASQAYALWGLYNQELVALHNQNSFPIIRYDIAPDSYAAKMESIVEGLGLEKRRNLSFRDEALRHESSKNEVVPEWLGALWEHLNDIAI